MWVPSAFTITSLSPLVAQLELLGLLRLMSFIALIAKSNKYYDWSYLFTTSKHWVQPHFLSKLLRDCDFY